jgi:hypothetical protein
MKLITTEATHVVEVPSESSDRSYTVQLGWVHTCTCPAFGRNILDAAKAEVSYPVPCKHITKAYDFACQVGAYDTGLPVQATKQVAGTPVEDRLQEAWWKGWDARGTYTELGQ